MNHQDEIRIYLLKKIVIHFLFLKLNLQPKKEISSRFNTTIIIIKKYKRKIKYKLNSGSDDATKKECK